MNVAAFVSISSASDIFFGVVAQSLELVRIEISQLLHMSTPTSSWQAFFPHGMVPDSGISDSRFFGLYASPKLVTVPTSLIALWGDQSSK